MSSAGQRLDAIGIYQAPWPGEPYRTFADFKIGKLELAKHLGVTDEVAVLIEPSYVEQLLLRRPSDLENGRSPLYVCRLCANLGCGAVTVRVEEKGDHFLWRDFGYETDYEPGYSQSDFMQRTGPFAFDREAYVALLEPYARSPVAG